MTDFLLSACQESREMDGEPIEFEWNIVPGLTSLLILQRIQSDFRERNIEFEEFGDRIIFMSMFNDIEWTRKGNEEICISNSKEVDMNAKRFWHENKSYGQCHYKSGGKGTSIASQMLHRFEERGRPVFTRASALSRGILRRLKGKETIHFNAGAVNTEKCSESFTQ